jgi:hypothetical protein
MRADKRMRLAMNVNVAPGKSPRAGAWSAPQWSATCRIDRSVYTTFIHRPDSKQRVVL